MATITCPHCGLAQEEGGQFCSSCGKALPSVVPTGPRVVTGNRVAATAAGKTVQADELRKEAGKAFGALLTVTILAALGALLILFIISNASSEGRVIPPLAYALLVAQFVIVAVFAGLAVWARYNPLPAAIAGLVLYATLVVVNVIANPELIGFGLFIPLLIVLVLIKAIQSGVRHKQLRDEMSAT